MKIGILSDTHNHLTAARRALDLLMKHGARHLVHCGDAGEEVIDLLSATCQEHSIRAHVAIGNCDRPHLPDPAWVPQPAGIERSLSPEFTVDHCPCIVVHGDNARRLEEIIASGRFAYVFTGHSHCRRDEQVGPTRVLNPGSCARPRNGPATVLLLDLPAGTATWLTV